MSVCPRMQEANKTPQNPTVLVTTGAWSQLGLGCHHTPQHLEKEKLLQSFSLQSLAPWEGQELACCVSLTKLRASFQQRYTLCKQNLCCWQRYTHGLSYASKFDWNPFSAVQSQTATNNCTTQNCIVIVSLVCGIASLLNLELTMSCQWRRCLLLCARWITRWSRSACPVINSDHGCPCQDAPFNCCAIHNVKEMFCSGFISPWSSAIYQIKTFFGFCG